MKIHLRLFAMLADRLPPGSEDHTMELEVPEGTTAREVVERMQIPQELASLTMLGGTHLSPREFERHHLEEGDTLSIFPPIAGGAEAARTVRVRKEMGVTRAEFLRVFPRLDADNAPETRRNRVILKEAGRRVEVVLSPTRQRALGRSLRLPYTWVELQFYGYSEAERERFLERFDREFFRGGG